LQQFGVAFDLKAAADRLRREIAQAQGREEEIMDELKESVAVRRKRDRTK
jgi:hypothetical protein